jgi:hypothetical protein
MDGITSTRSLARRVLCLLPPLRDWFAEVDGLASDARAWRAVRTALQAEKIIAATRHIIADQEQAEIIDFLSYLTPCRSRRFGKIRLGRNGDGGYVLLDDFTGVSAALSFGIARECSWDSAMAQRGIDVYQYDHTVDGPTPGFGSSRKRSPRSHAVKPNRLALRSQSCHRRRNASS